MYSKGVVIFLHKHSQWLKPIHLEMKYSNSGEVRKLAKERVQSSQFVCSTLERKKNPNFFGGLKIKSN